MPKILLCSLLLMFSFCSAIDSEDFYNRTTGRYTLNEDGSLFLKREIGMDVPTGATLEFRGTGEMFILQSATSAILLAKLDHLQSSDYGSFKLSPTNSYIAMGYVPGSPNSHWLSSTNTFSNANAVLYEHMIPIATKNDEE